MEEVEVIVEQNGGEYHGTCLISVDAPISYTSKDNKTIELHVNGVTVTLKFDERIDAYKV